MKELYKKIALAQSEFPTMKKNETVSFGNTKYKFFDINQMLDVMLPIIEKHGLLVLQPLTNVDGKSAIKTIVIEKESGESMEETFTFEDMGKPQDTGSAITYFRRYSLQALFCLESEDEDAKNVKKQPKKDTLTEKHANWGKVTEYMATASADIKNVTDKYNVSEDLIKKLTQ